MLTSCTICTRYGKVNSVYSRNNDASAISTRCGDVIRPSAHVMLTSAASTHVIVTSVASSCIVRCVVVVVPATSISDTAGVSRDRGRPPSLTAAGISLPVPFLLPISTMSRRGNVNELKRLCSAFRCCCCFCC